MWRVLKVVGWTLIWSGGLIFAFLAYQIWGTGLLAARSQAVAEDQLADVLSEARDQLPEPVVVVEHTPEEKPEVEELVEAEIVELFTEQQVDTGLPFGRLSIPKIEVDEVIFSGVDRSTLKQGPGHMPWTPLPGQPGNAVLSGHRTTYGKPFNRLDNLAPGDTIEVETALGWHTYEVREVFVVLPTDVWVTDPKAGAWLTLTTCHPEFSARERLVVWAELVQGPNLDYVQHLQAEMAGEAA